MNLYSKITLIWIVSIGLYSCRTAAVTDYANFTIQCGKLLGYGDLEYDSYTFCGIVPFEQQTSLKVGVWEFRDQEYRLRCKGRFDSYIVHIETNCEGGADVLREKINVDEWEFYNNKGETLVPTVELIQVLEECRQ